MEHSAFGALVVDIRDWQPLCKSSNAQLCQKTEGIGIPDAQQEAILSCSRLIAAQHAGSGEDSRKSKEITRLTSSATMC